MARTGRPKKPEGTKKDVHISTRFSAELKERLEAAAAVNHRKLSREIEFRLAHSFHEDADNEQWGGAPAYEFFLMAAVTLDYLSWELGAPWYENPFVFEAARKAIGYLLDERTPAGKPKLPLTGPHVETLMVRGKARKAELSRLEKIDWGKTAAEEILAMLKHLAGPLGDRSVTFFDDAEQAPDIVKQRDRINRMVTLSKSIMPTLSKSSRAKSNARRTPK